MINHIDIIIDINKTEKEIGKLTYTIRYGNYGSQAIQVFRNQLEYQREKLELLKKLERIYYQEL